MTDAAAQHDTTSVTIASVRQLLRSPRTSPLAGTTSTTHLKQILAAAQTDLGDDEIAAITVLVAE